MQRSVQLCSRNSKTERWAEPGPAEALMDWSAVEPSRSPLQILCASYLVQLEQHPVTPSL